ncbi:hypothetical protein E5Q_02909 [Mixia osmundae IAM 14324]|uniref:Heparinase II N-terminal domain-containing protein n=1 Tax=Mixia osmundae (strain CBS 9802 / IAM 14324 / JCM 22182 / KY 12970) TaxID=764103 RepID=G7E085_MIXOS|nr:hypothetical protein E5Q_02909 [Mixia osmundae IAM 14324]
MATRNMAQHGSRSQPYDGVRYQPAHNPAVPRGSASSGSSSGATFPAGSHYADFEKQRGASSPQALTGGRPRQKKWYASKWVKIGLPLLLIAIIIGAVLGGVLGSRRGNSSSSSTGSGSSSGGSRSSGTGQSQIVVPSLDANGNPVYPSKQAIFANPSVPTYTTNSTLLCSDSAFAAGSGQSGNYQVRGDHPRLFATATKWDCLRSNIAQDAYLAYWNETIFANATKLAALSPTNYSIDGGLSGSGVLDVAREVQLRLKHWGYAWKMSNDTKWADRAWQEVLVASGNSSDQYFGNTGDNWNSQHFLDVGEFTAAFGMAYDWFHDAWTAEQLDATMWSIITLGLQYGLNSYTESTGYGWWQTTNGNWNCVCNGGLTIGALAIRSEDPTGIAAQVLGYTIPNAQQNCAFGVTSDGTWSETSDYWYFGTNGHAQMTGALITATGSDQEMLTSNPNFNKTGLFHIYGTGFVQKFNYGDCGPNKYTATANGLMLYGDQLDIPLYALYQRERLDAPEPLSVLYYNPEVNGTWWNGLALDHYFPGGGNAWASMRSTWTDPTGLYAAIKAGNATGHQTHQDIDAGDFVLEALGQRFFGELCQAQYLADGYFSSEGENSERWLYYRTRTEGQNSLLIGGLNQNVDAQPPTTYDSTAEAQDVLEYSAPSTSTAFFTADLTATYNGTSVSRAMRMINGRRQVLLQDEIGTINEAVQWRAHTNATISISGSTATLSLNGETMQAIIQSPSGASWGTAQPVRLSTDPALPSDSISQDLPNPGVTVLTIDLSASAASGATLAVLFNPQWPNFSSYSTPPVVAIDQWSLTSHN